MLRHYLIYNAWPAVSDQMFGSEEITSEPIIQGNGEVYKIDTLKLVWNDSISVALENDHNYDNVKKKRIIVQL